MTEQKLLTVLDLPNAEQQIKALYDFGYTEYFVKLACGDGIKYECRTGSLADLAFRLRDEVLNSKNGTIKWVDGMFDVYMKMTGSKLLNWKRGYIEAKPIHWVIAALIAKESK